MLKQLISLIYNHVQVYLIMFKTSNDNSFFIVNDRLVIMNMSALLKCFKKVRKSLRKKKRLHYQIANILGLEN